MSDRKFYGLWSDSLQSWAKSGGDRVEFWGLEAARAGWLEWQTAGAPYGADWEIRRIPGAY